jgi:dTMP kinase
MRRPGYLAGFDDYGISPKNKEPESSEEDELILEARREIEQQAAKLEAQGMAGFGQTPEPDEEDALILEARREIEQQAAKLEAQGMAGFGQYYPRTGVRVRPRRSNYYSRRRQTEQARLQAQLEYAQRLKAWQEQKHAWEMARAKELDDVAAAAAKKAAADAAAQARKRQAAAAAAAAAAPAPAPPAPVVKPSKGMPRP